MKYAIVQYTDLGGNFTGSSTTEHVQIFEGESEEGAHEKAEFFIKQAKGILGNRMCNIVVLSDKNGQKVNIVWLKMTSFSASEASKVTQKQLHDPMGLIAKLHIPRGNMCLACVRSKRVCSKSLDFSKMRQHSENDYFVVVICSDFKKVK